MSQRKETKNHEYETLAFNIDDDSSRFAPGRVGFGYCTHALKARDIDKVMSFVADDAVFIDPGGRYSGQAEIRATTQSAINDGVIVEVSNVSDTNGRLVYEYEVFVDGGLFTLGTGLTIVKDGKIVFDGTEST
jgi:hypothetical protein